MISFFAARSRKRRFELFRSFMARVERPLDILDIGGEPQFWEVAGLAGDAHVHITLVNIRPLSARAKNFTVLTGDARHMPRFNDGQFDVVFSNSVIEHVGPSAEQERMANEVKRLGKRYFIQTPNYYFPLEPHFHFPGFQFLPLSVRAQLAHRFDLGAFRRGANLDEARQKAESIQLLKRSDVARLFPNAKIWEEKVLGMTKSFVAHDGWD
jgi:SAM-dependent methyltransferase